MCGTIRKTVDLVVVSHARADRRARRPPGPRSTGVKRVTDRVCRGAPHIPLRLAGVGAVAGTIVATMGFWDRQVEELMAGIAALLDGGRTAWDAHDGYPASPSPPIARGMPITAGSDETVTHASRTVLVEWTGRGADALNELQESIRHQQSARTEADRRLRDAVMAIHAAAQRAHERLQGVRAEVATGTAALQSTMDTTTGQQQMAEFLAAKARDVQVVINEAREASTSQAAGLGEARARYDSSRG